MDLTRFMGSMRISSNRYSIESPYGVELSGSIVEIELQNAGKRQCFKRIFVALKSCLDEFLDVCKPYIGVDSTSLHGKYTTQLASITSVGGHN